MVSKDYRSLRFGEEVLWFLGEPVADKPLAETQAFYPVAGYAIQRSGWNAHDSQVIFDCGGLGMLNGGHGHADALSLVVNVGGTEILTDPGTCVYNGSPEWRNFFRSTRAHNTVVVDGADQSVPDGTFKWRKKAQSRVVRHLAKEGFNYIEAENDGYRDAPHNILHRRRLLHLSPGLWVVADDLAGPPQQHIFDSYFHFPANSHVSIQQENERVLRVSACADSARLKLLVCASASMQAKTVEGQINPIQGWVSQTYGHKSPAPTLRIGMETRAPASGMFIMLPSYSAAPDPEVTTRSVSVTGGSALACEAECDGIRDIFVSSPGGQLITIPDFSLNGCFFWLRMKHGELAQVLGIDCKEIRFRDSVLMHDDSGRSHFRLLDDQNG
jgi:hypothetical protein